MSEYGDALANGSLPKIVRRPAVAAALGLSVIALSACASIQGAPNPIRPGVSPADNCPSDLDIAGFEGQPLPSSSTKRALRDAKIAACVAQVDAAYAAFVRQLHSQSVGANVFLDMAALGLTSAGAVAGGSTASVLSAASTSVVGAGASLNKDVFYQKTLPAIIAQMDANRSAIYKSIRLAEQSDETVYTLGDAQHDVRDYEEAGTVDAAISAITTSAQQSTTDNQNTVHALFTATVVPADVHAREAAAAKYVKSLDLTVAGNVQVLTNIATALNIPVAQGEAPKAIRRDVLIAMDKEAIDKASMDALVPKLKPYTEGP